MLNYLIDKEPEFIINEIEKIICKYGLPKGDNFKKYSKEYLLLKNNFNLLKNIEELIVLVLYGFNQQIRFNSNEEFNIPSGKFCWNEYQKNKFLNYCKSTKDKKISIYNLDFYEFVEKTKANLNKEKSIFYFDPPYLISNATYNNKWCEKKERQLVYTLEKLTNEGYKWFLSNILFSKGVENKILSSFLKNVNNISYEYISNVDYKNSNYNRKTYEHKDVEILVKGNL